MNIGEVSLLKIEHTLPQSQPHARWRAAGDTEARLLGGAIAAIEKHLGIDKKIAA
jgi:hypothetical protein